MPIMATVRDLYLDGNHDIVLSGADLRLVSGSEAIRQAADVRLKFFAQEWFLDLSAGVPWFQSILIKNPNLSAVAQIFRDQLLATPGIAVVEQLGLNYTSEARTLRINWRATSDEGELIESSPEVTV